MTTITDDGLDFYNEKSIDETSATIDTIAVGTGTGSESQTPTGLSSEVYRGVVTDTNINFSAITGEGRMEAVITLKGGTEVSGGTEITEMLVEASDGTIIAIDNFSAVTVEAGHTEEFTLPIVVQRPA